MSKPNSPTAAASPGATGTAAVSVLPKSRKRTPKSPTVLAAEAWVKEAKHLDKLIPAIANASEKGIEQLQTAITDRKKALIDNIKPE